MDGWMDGWTEGQMNGWTDGWVEGSLHPQAADIVMSKHIPAQASLAAKSH